MSIKFYFHKKVLGFYPESLCLDRNMTLIYIILFELKDNKLK